MQMTDGRHRTGDSDRTASDRWSRQTRRCLSRRTRWRRSRAVREMVLTARHAMKDRRKQFAQRAGNGFDRPAMRVAGRSKPFPTRYATSGLYNLISSCWKWVCSALQATKALLGYYMRMAVCSVALLLNCPFVQFFTLFSQFLFNRPGSSTVISLKKIGTSHTALINIQQYD